jgi:hypothetical protein
MGQKMACLGHRGTARSRQDEPKEVGEVGSKRTSSGCNGVHHVWWGGLIFRLLPSRGLVAMIPIILSVGLFDMGLRVVVVVRRLILWMGLFLAPVGVDVPRVVSFLAVPLC